MLFFNLIMPTSSLHGHYLDTIIHVPLRRLKLTPHGMSFWWTNSDTLFPPGLWASQGEVKDFGGFDHQKNLSKPINHCQTSDPTQRPGQGWLHRGRHKAIYRRALRSVLSSRDTKSPVRSRTSKEQKAVRMIYPECPSLAGHVTRCYQDRRSGHIKMQLYLNIIKNSIPGLRESTRHLPGKMPMCHLNANLCTHYTHFNQEIQNQCSKVGSTLGWLTMKEAYLDQVR